MLPIIFSVVLFSALGYFSLPTFKECPNFRTSAILFVCSSIYLILLFGLRNRYVGTDTTHYVDFFLFPDNGYYSADSDVGFTLFSRVAHLFLSTNITGYLCLCSAISLGGFLFLVYKKSSNYALSLCCFWLFFTTEGMFSWYASMMRQVLAMGFCFLMLFLLDLPNKKVKEWILIFIVGVIAISIHGSSIFAIIFYLLAYIIKSSEKFLIFLFVAIPITYVLGANNFFSIDSLLPMGLNMLAMADGKYGEYGNISFGYVGPTYFMVNMFSLPYTLIALVSLFIIKKKKSLTLMNSIVFKSFFIGVLLTNLMANNLMWGRLLGYFSMLVYIVFPNCLEKTSLKWKLILFTPFFILFLQKTWALIIRQYTSQSGIILYPYVFFN